MNTKFRNEGSHLKHLECSEYSPLLLSACLSSHDYNDALKVLKHQGLNLNNVKIHEEFKVMENDRLELFGHQFVGEYLAYCGGENAMSEYLEKIGMIVLELQARDRIS